MAHNWTHAGSEGQGEGDAACVTNSAGTIPEARTIHIAYAIHFSTPQYGKLIACDLDRVCDNGGCAVHI